jgi:tetratricopeptide (TPR) repeat protein
MKPALLLVITWFGTLPDAPGAEAVVPDCDAKLGRLRTLAQDRRWSEIVEQFAQEDFAAWPPDTSRQASEALTHRGLAYSFLKDGKRAAVDLGAATQLDPKNALAWMALGDNYANHLHDERQALTAYRQALAVTGTNHGWQSLSTTLSIVRILTDQVQTDQALAALRPYDDLPSVAPSWRVRLLRAYGHAYAAQGNEAESLAKFREALRLESKP